MIFAFLSVIVQLVAPKRARRQEVRATYEIEAAEVVIVD
jgi:hypothetical protein